MAHLTGRRAPPTSATLHPARLVPTATCSPISGCPGDRTLAAASASPGPTACRTAALSRHTPEAGPHSSCHRKFCIPPYRTSRQHTLESSVVQQLGPQPVASSVRAAKALPRRVRAEDRRPTGSGQAGHAPPRPLRPAAPAQHHSAAKPTTAAGSGQPRPCRNPSTTATMSSSVSGISWAWSAPAGRRRLDGWLF